MTEQDYNKILREIMPYQAVINIGTLGQASNGKTTLTKDLTNVVTQKSKIELQSNKTVKLGYANGKIYKCNNCEKPLCYQSTSSEIMEHLCNLCNNPTELIIHFSITDVPGHNSYMSTMLNGTYAMDKAILVESCANNDTLLPARQTVEHFNITKEIGIQTAFACLNKIDLITKTPQKIPTMIEKIRNLIGENVPVIPISGTHNLNIDVVREYIANMEIPKKDIESNFKMIIVRSFNCNKPNTKICDLKGGIIGGSLSRGILKVGDNVLVYPGLIKSVPLEQQTEEEPFEWSYLPFECNVISLNSETVSLEKAIPGGFIGVQLDIDPGLSRNDNLSGQIMFKKTEDMSNVRVGEQLKVKFTKIDKEKKFKKGESLLINCNSNKIECLITKVSSENITLKLSKPVCLEINDKISILKNNNDDDSKEITMHILGYGVIIDCLNCKLLK